MGVEIAALMGFFGLTSAFALVATILAAWMAWRIVEKTGLPGWAGLGAILLTLTGVGSIVPLVLLWVFAFMRWPRDEPGRATLGYGAAPAGGPARPAPPRALAAPAAALADRRGWKLTGGLPGGAVALAIDGSVVGYVLTGAPAAQPGELSRARSLGRSPACQAHDRLRPPRAGGSGNRRGHLHRRGAPAARARSARHQRGPLDPSRHRRACPVEGLNRA